MIVKKIHYCWFGRNPLPEEAVKCIDTWKKVLPEYEIIEWNEDNFDINSNNYVHQAYEARKFAFVSDYLRLYVLYKYGGIYMDTDVEVLKPLDEFLHHPAFSGFENNNSVPTGIMAAKKGSKWAKYLLDEYDNLSFIKEDKSLDLTTNVTRITNASIEKYNLIPNNTFQDLGDIVYYPHEYFCPKDWETGEIHITDNTYTIHHFNGSWHTPKEKKELLKKRRLIEKYGADRGNKKWNNKMLVKKVGQLPIRFIKNPIKMIKKVIKKTNEKN